jgi:hypothetical protein
MLNRVQIGGMYFSGFCSVAGREVLLGPANLVDLRKGANGFELHYSCHCGRSGVVFPGLEAVGRCGDAVALGRTA